MFLKELHLRQFRSYPQLDLSLHPGLNVFVGGNGAGKSNLLEAVSVLARGESHRDAESRNLFPWDKDELLLEGSFDGEESLLVNVRQQRGRPRQVKVNNAFQKRLRDWIGRAPAVSFSPEDLDLVKGDPAGRRKVLNAILCQTIPGYADLLQRYAKILDERNAGLRAVQEGKRIVSSLEPWDLALLKEGAALTLARRDFLILFEPLVAERHKALSSEREALQFIYKPSFRLPLSQGFSPPKEPLAENDGEAAEVVAANRRRLQDLRDGEVAIGNTLIGPQRDDVDILLNGRPAKDFSSQGQQRTLAIAFKLAERDFLKERLGREPLCLLDDMFSELDPSRRENLLRLLSNGVQCLVTATSHDDWKGDNNLEASVFHVASGEVRPDLSFSKQPG